MPWDTALAADQLTITGTAALVQRSAADWEIDLEPEEKAHVQFEYQRHLTTPTEDAWIAIETSPDGGTTWDNVPFDVVVLDEDDAVSNLVIQSYIVEGPRRFRLKAKLVDDDLTPGGDDATGDGNKPLLDVTISTNGVAA